MKNDVILHDDYVEIVIVRRNGDEFKTKIDYKGYEKIKGHKYKWHVWYNKNNDSFYVMSTMYQGLYEGKPKYKVIYLHRYLTNAGEGDYVDHVNHDTLDNRSSNLELKTNSENLFNRKGANKNNKSTGVRNVSKVEGKYIVQFSRMGNRTRLGPFDTLDQAKLIAETFRKWA